jgi:hypothetical protein
MNTTCIESVRINAHKPTTETHGRVITKREVTISTPKGVRKGPTYISRRTNHVIAHVLTYILIQADVSVAQLVETLCYKPEGRKFNS